MLVYLDIDGVMVPAQNWKAPVLLEDGFPAFSKRAVDALCQILTNKNTIVLTSSHKSNFSLGEWKAIFERRGIYVADIFSLPKNISNLSRKDELSYWINLNKTATDFIIIDDDSSLHELDSHLKEKWIRTNPSIGLTEEHLDSIKKILARHSLV